VAEALAAGLELEAVFVGPGGSAPDGVSVPVHPVSAAVIDAVGSTVTPQPVIAVARTCAITLAAVAASRPAMVVVMAGVADPGNAGTILRSAEAAGADAVVLTEGAVDPFNPKVVRASVGALFHVPVVVDVPLGALASLRVPLLGAQPVGGTPYDEAPLSDPFALVVGNEAHGLPGGLPLDGIISIPHAGRAESLNVAMAATVICFEAARRRRYRAG
jgi:TrmH family RNA methyltransferase